ncbi:MAG: 4-hydroxyphenylacetate 3-hydroxylase family protein, partial [Hyphomicrobiaceae bacterium]
MPARTGRQYLDGLRSQGREIWLGGERVRDVTTHPGLAGGARAIAALYDMQHDPALRSRMTYASPTTGDPVGLSFIVPRTRDDLVRRREMMLTWARATCGMMGRSPDFMNVTFAAWAAAASYFAKGRPEFGGNIRRYYEHIRENDLVLTHALVNLQRSRSITGLYKLEEGTALGVVRETDAGIVVKGARVLATLGPFADEIAVYTPRLGQYADGSSPYALSFSIPCSTSGLKFLCRDSFDHGRSTFDQPLSSRFEEMDCIVFFDDVLVPWERVFILGDVGLLNGVGLATNYSAHSSHQGAAKNLAKCELVLGLALLMTETLGNGHLPQTEAMIGELMLTTTLMKAAMRAAEADAQLDQWGVMCPEPVTIESTRNLFMTAYPRMVEIL